MAPQGEVSLSPSKLWIEKQRSLPGLYSLVHPIAKHFAMENEYEHFIGQVQVVPPFFSVFSHLVPNEYDPGGTPV